MRAFFDLLPDDVLRLIVRQVSVSPRDDATWRRSIPGSVFLDAKGPFAGAMSTLVSHIALTSRSPKELPPGDSVSLCINSSDEFVENAITTFGPALTALTIQSYPRMHSAFESRLLASMLSNSGQLRSLSIVCDISAINWNGLVPALFRGIGAQLRALQFRPQGAFGTSVAYAFEHIAANCRNLRRISIELPFRVPLSSTMPLWDKLGDTLRDVQLAFDIRYPVLSENKRVWEHLIARLRDRCRRLQSVKLDPGIHRHGYHLQLADMYASFGQRLRRASLYYLDHDSCAKVARACPYLQADLTVEAEQWREICALGARISRLCVSEPIELGPANFQRLSMATRLCTNLRELVVRSANPDNDWCGAILHAGAKKPLLHTLELDVKSAKLSEDALQNLAAGTGGLKHIKVECAMLEEGLAFREVAMANPHIETISITQTVAPAEAQNAAVTADLTLCDTMDAFVDCQQLRQLALQYRRAWVDVSEVVRGRFQRLCRELKRKYVILEVNTRVID